MISTLVLGSNRHIVRTGRREAALMLRLLFEIRKERMRRYNFSLHEQRQINGTVKYSFKISSLCDKSFHDGAGLIDAVKRYEDEESYRRDVDEDFRNHVTGELKANQTTHLSDERAKYYGWSET